MTTKAMQGYIIGDNDSFAEIYQATFSTVFGLLKRLTRNNDRAWDLTQKTYLKFHIARGAYKGGPIGPWLSTIARNAWIDEQRKRAYEAAFCMQVKERQYDIEDQILARDTLAHIYEEVSEALLATRLEGKSYREVADSIGIPINTLRSRIRRNSERLKAMGDD